MTAQFEVSIERKNKILQNTFLPYLPSLSGRHEVSLPLLSFQLRKRSRLDLKRISLFWNLHTIES